MQSIRRCLWILVVGTPGWGAGPALELPAATVGIKYVGQAVVALPFGDAVAPLTYSSTMATGAWLQVDPVTGALSGIPSIADSVGMRVTVSVHDGATPPHSSSQEYLLRVQDGAREVQLIPRIVEGAMLISGVATPSAKIRILDVGQGDRGYVLPLQTGDSALADATTGVFAAILIAPVYAGQTIRIEQQQSNSSRVAGPVIQVPGLADWGRVRASFAGGIVLSAANRFQGASAQSTVFLGVNLDKNWRWAGLTPAGAFTGRVMFNSYFDVRLTSVPVSGETDNLSAFAASVKSAELQGGAYFPILVSHWTWQNAPNALFIAPLAKVGFITPTDANYPSQFYNFYAFGARAGHFKLSANSDSAPELMSYIDVVAGRFSNLETLAPSPTRRWRIEIEGVLKMPASPFLLGFDANIGQKLLTPPTVESAPDDLRFFIGAKFDIGKLMGKLQQF